MPTADYSNTLRTARVRQAVLSVGVSKAGNSSSGSLHMARVLGGVPIKVKNSAGLSLNNTPVDTTGQELYPTDDTLALYDFVSRRMKVTYEDWIGYTAAIRTQLYNQALLMPDGGTYEPDGGGGDGSGGAGGGGTYEPDDA